MIPNICMINSDDEKEQENNHYLNKMQEKSITEINLFLKNTVNNLGLISITGEICNISNSNGNTYFLLSDQVNKMNCILWDINNKGIILNTGEIITCFGNIEMYSKMGKIFMNIHKIIKKKKKKSNFNILKEKLEKQGYFNKEHKKKINKNNYKIGIVTSKNSAAIKDILSVIKRKTKYVKIYITDTKVQGIGASKMISESIRKLDSMNLDVIVVTRGGGSDDDLSCFNSKELVKTIYNCNTAIISGVGHEKDITLCDLVADKKCITPSIAGFDCVTGISNCINKINEKFQKIKDLYLQKKMNLQNTFNHYEYKTKYYSPLQKINRNSKLVDLYFNSIIHDFEKYQKNQIEYLDILEKKNTIFNPEYIFRMGFFLLKNKDGYIRNINEVKNYKKFLIINDNLKLLIKNSL